MDRMQPQLAIVDRRVAILELGARGAQRLDLGPLEHDSALEPLDQLIAMRGVAVGRHIACADLALPALGHPLSLTCGSQVDAPARGFHARDANLDRIAQAQRRSSSLAAEDRPMLVQLPPLATAVLAGVRTATARRGAPLLAGGPWPTCPPSGSAALRGAAPAPVTGRARGRLGHGRECSERKHAAEGRRLGLGLLLLGVRAAEAHERARRDQPRYLARELLVVTVLVEEPLQGEAACDVVGVALDDHRLALAFGGPRTQLRELAGARGALTAADGREQRSMADDVRIASDRRGEVAVAGGAQPRMAEVPWRVVGLLEGAEHERAEREPSAARAPYVRLHLLGYCRDQLRGLRGRHGIGKRRGCNAERGKLLCQPLNALGIRPLVHLIV